MYEDFEINLHMSREPALYTPFRQPKPAGWQALSKDSASRDDIGVVEYRLVPTRRCQTVCAFAMQTSSGHRSPSHAGPTSNIGNILSLRTSS
jgi:hypothetical protein